MSLNKILLLDAHDSFPAALIYVVQKLSGVSVEHRYNDDPSLLQLDSAAFTEFLQQYTAIVAGSGPGNPSNARDIGVIERIWSLPIGKDVPVLAIGLGAQSLALANNAAIHPLQIPRHGIAFPIAHVNTDIFSDAGEVLGTQYASFRINLGHAAHENNWQPSAQCPQLQPLAWLLSDTDNGPTCIALKHATRPQWGLLYRPESAATNRAGAAVIRSWWYCAREYNRRARMALTAVDFWFRTNRQNQDQPSFVGPRGRDPDPVRVPMRTVQSQKVSLRGLTMRAILDAVSTDHDARPSVLPSGPRQGTGHRFQIIALNASPVFEYFLVKDRCRYRSSSTGPMHEEDTSEPWSRVKTLLEHIYASSGQPHLPFWGGLLGFASYNACLASAGVERKVSASDRPDVAFVLVERSLVVDHAMDEVWVQSIAPNDLAWVASTAQHLEHIDRDADHAAASPPPVKPSSISTPTRAAYFAQLQQCQDRIRAGDAATLTLATSSHITFPSSAADAVHAHLLHHTARSTSSTFLHLPFTDHTLTITRPTPTHDLTFTRAGAAHMQHTGAHVPRERGTTELTATQRLTRRAETAQHTAAIDRARGAFYAAAAIRAPPAQITRLCALEATPRGWTSASALHAEMWPHVRATDVLRHALPFASTTGTPVKRAARAALEIERAPRGVLGGALGFFDVGGAGEWAALRGAGASWRARDRGGGAGAGGGVEGERDVWTVGAGAGVAVESEMQEAWEDMMGERRAGVEALAGAMG